MRAPQPTLGQKVNDYRVETLRMMKRTFLPQNHLLYKVNYRGLRNDSAMIEVFEPKMLQAVPIEAFNPAHVPPGEMKKIERLDEYGKVKFVEFVGQECFTKQMMRPGRRVASFWTEQGPVGADGRYLRR
jgi:hypothetical protein